MSPAAWELCRLCGARSHALSPRHGVSGGLCSVCESSRTARAASKQAGAGCRACRQLKPNVSTATTLCSECENWVIQMARTTPLSAQDAIAAIQTIQTLDGAALTGYVAQLPGSALNGWRRKGREADEDFRRRVMALFPLGAASEADQELGRTPRLGGVSQEEFSQLPDWDYTVLETHTNEGKLQIELVDFATMPETGPLERELLLSWAQPAREEGEDPPVLNLPQRLLGARVLRDVDNDRILFLTVGRGVLGEPPRAPLNARDRVMFASEAGNVWTEIGRCTGYFSDVLGEVLEWSYELGPGGPVLVVILEREEADYPPEVLERARELGAEQFAACLLGEVTPASEMVLSNPF